MKKKIADEQKLFHIIQNVLQYKSRGDVPIGVESMDDCALIKISDEDSIAISSDFIRGSAFTLFQLGLLNYFDVGFYLISANLSDLASMGARPIGLSTIVRYADMDDDDFENVFRGMKAAADVHNAQIIGGDIGSYKADVLAATAFGLVKTKNALLRKNVKDGDLICVTGTVGRAITALIYFKEAKNLGFSFTSAEEDRLLSAWRRPQARIKEGQLLSNALGNACQDISDGLKATIEQMSKLSNKTFTVYERDIPIDPATIKLADFFQIDPVRIAISASVDFELLFSIPEEKKNECLRKFKIQKMKMTIIGQVNDYEGNILIDNFGIRKELPGIIWDQRPVSEIINEILNKK